MELSRIHGDLCENQNDQMRTEYNRDNEKVIINIVKLTFSLISFQWWFFFHRVHIERLCLRDFSAVLVQPPVQRKTRLNMENLFIQGFFRFYFNLRTCMI